jgi:hypothetical protein
MYDKLKIDNKDDASADVIINSCERIIKSMDIFITSTSKGDIFSLKSCITEQLLEFENIYEKYSQSK